MGYKFFDMGLVPSLVQGLLDQSTINITNATLYFPKDLRSNPWAIQEVHAVMTNAGPTPVTLYGFTQKMTMKGDYSLVGVPKNVTSVQIAEYEFPELYLKGGANNIHVSVNMSLQGLEECGKSITCFNAFQSAIGFADVFPTVNAFMELASDDMTVQTLGVQMPGKYHSKFNMSCFVNAGGAPPEHALNVSELDECIAAGGCVKPTQIRCGQVDSFDPNVTTLVV